MHGQHSPSISNLISILIGQFQSELKSLTCGGLVSQKTVCLECIRHLAIMNKEQTMKTLHSVRTVAEASHLMPKHRQVHLAHQNQSLPKRQFCAVFLSFEVHEEQNTKLNLHGFLRFEVAKDSTHGLLKIDSGFVLPGLVQPSTCCKQRSCWRCWLIGLVLKERSGLSHAKLMNT